MNEETEQSVSRPTGTDSGRERRRRHLRRRRAISRWGSRVFMLGLLVVMVAVAVVLQTARGHRVALDFALERVRGSLAGELRVGGIRSNTLLAGATLDELVLTDARGRPAISADSVVVRYLPTGLLTGAPRLRSVILWGLDFEISTLAEDDELNLSRLLTPDEASPDSAANPIELFVGQVGVRDGRVSVLSPAETGERAGVVPGPRGPLRRLGLDGLDLDLEDAVLRLGEEASFASDLASLSMRLSLPDSEEPLRVREAFGRLAFDLEEGLTVQEGAFRLPETLGRGAVELGPSDQGEGWAFQADLSVDEWGDLADLRWADPRIPDGLFRGSVAVATGEHLDLTLGDVDVRLAASNLTIDGGVSFGASPSTRDLAVTASPVALSRLEPWLERTIPLEGWLSGRTTLSGPLDDLRATGRLTLVPAGYGGQPTTVDFSGGVHLGADVGWTGFEARADPLNYELVRIVAPDLPFGGTGTAEVQLDGRLAREVGVVASMMHESSSAPVSRVHARGTVSRPDSVWTVDLSGDLAPLSLAALSDIAPELELQGELRGPLTARGPFDALEVAGEMDGARGSVRLNGRVNLFEAASGYRLELEADDFHLTEISGRMPDPAAWTGTLSVEGSGFSLDSVAGRAMLDMFSSRVGGLAIDSVSTAFRAEAGMLHADSLVGSIGGVRFRGGGRLGMRPDEHGEAEIRFSTESLVGLRPSLMGDSLIVRDELTSLERELLRVEGVDPDTLPSAEDVRLEGAVDGTATLFGRLAELGVDLRASLVGGAYGSHQVDSMRLALTVGGLPSLEGSWDVQLDATGVEWSGRSFERASFEGAMTDRSGEGRALLTRRASEWYEVAGDFVLDSVGGAVRFDEAAATIDERSWTLSRPAAVTWDGTSLTVDTLDVRRTGDDPMHFVAHGTLTRGGDSDFTVDIGGFHVEEIGTVAQSDAIDIAGHMDLALHLRGPAEAPLIDADLAIVEPRFRNIEMSRLSGTMTYRGRSMDVSLEAREGDRRALVASGTIPMDLALADVEARRLDEPMDVSISADSLSAGVALAYFGTLEDVEGTLSGEVQIEGTAADPVPSGSVELEGAAWSIEGLGVRHRNVSGSLELTGDRTMSVDLETRGTGVSTVSGTVGLTPLSDPSLDLEVSFDRFRAMNRRDIEGIISGQFTLSGTYQRPLAEGAVTVDEGTLQVDEFSRAAGVVDLTDPRLFGQGLAVDTTVFMSQPILSDVRNPFLDNLRVDVELSVPRDTWLRSNDMNVEMGGDLLVRYDRNAGDLVLIGELQALRGTYLVLGRTFDVDEGSVSFIGRPGVNPTLNINATSRVRRIEGEDIVIRGTVEGTLVQPRVTLASEEGELSQSDLISYLVFNRSAAELGRSQQSFFNSQLNSGALSTAATAVSSGFTVLTGAFFSQSGAAIAQNLGLDYLSVSRGVEGLGLTSAQLEAGSYLGDDVFIVAVVRPFADQDINPWGGVRVEWSLTDAYNLEAFVEDQFLRSGTGLFGIGELGGEQIYGVLLFREWGYNE
ncbi:MAG: translocation/assembly module TamB domain-containing protein [Gemmatimonadota bacterium]|nr:translocation/assembly module TamB domain-containing protein [Gemmatimonadota bacterium]